MRPLANDEAAAVGPDEGRWNQSAAAAVTEWLAGLALGRGGCTQGKLIGSRFEVGRGPHPP
jgi:hypothetical protein